MQSDKEMIEWAGITYEGEEIPEQLKRLIWIARQQGLRIAWRDMYQISAAQHASYSGLPNGPAATNSESAKGSSAARTAPG